MRDRSIASTASRVRADIAFAVVDAFVIVAAYTLGLGLRMLDPLVGDASEFWTDLAVAMPFIVLIHIGANVIAGAYGHVWEYASTNEAARVAMANVGAGTVLIVLTLWVRQLDGLIIPYSVIVVGGLVSLFAMGLIRFRSRLFSFRKLGSGPKVLVVGTGRDAVAFARQAPGLDGGRQVVGFVDNGSKTPSANRRLAGLQILGPLTEIASLVERHGVDEVVVVGGDAAALRRVVDLCLDVDVRLRTLPAAEDIMREEGASIDVRDIQVEDLLARKPVQTDLSAVAELISGKVVLVTGAGGSIGSEIVRQVLSFEPAAVYALDRDETLLHDARLRWKGSTWLELADVRDPRLLLRLFDRISPQIVFHAAALKHVPLLEYHPGEAVLTNVIGTRNVVEAGSRAGMERFVLISTDKAVNPASVMGATKRVAELITEAGHERRDGCVYTAVRFGNVLGSRGSVIPTFIDQIKAGGPVTVTDPGMTRFFMTVDEAVQLVLQASAMAQGSEVFLLDMGEPVRIEDLARRLIRLAGLAPGKDIEIRFTGRRPGERLAEMLSREPLQPTANRSILEVKLDHTPAQVVIEAVADLEEAALSGGGDRVIALLRDLTGGELMSRDSAIFLEDDISKAIPWS